MGYNISRNNRFRQSEGNAAISTPTVTQVYQYTNQISGDNSNVIAASEGQTIKIIALGLASDGDNPATVELVSDTTTLFIFPLPSQGGFFRQAEADGVLFFGVVSKGISLNIDGSTVVSAMIQYVIE